VLHLRAAKRAAGAYSYWFARPAHLGETRREDPMKRIVQPLSKDADDDSIEHGVIAVGIALALLAIVGQIGGALNTAF
jgi:Flp pilus assembly pilin Flp